MSITGYYDGNAVQTDAKLDLNQKVLIVPITGGTAAGILHEFADTEMISSEKEAWKKAAVEKHGGI